MSAESAWEAAMAEAAEVASELVGLVQRDEMAVSLRSLPMPPAFRAEVEAEMEKRVARALCCPEKKGENCRVVNCAAKTSIHIVMARAAVAAMRGEP